MYAIVDIAGQQFKVQQEEEVIVHRLQGETGTNVVFDNVLLVEKKGKIEVGSPKVDGAKVSAKIVEHLKGDKITIFKKKRRKNYQKSNGHRQYLTKIIIEKITA
jgi:large subunit ribosomal protein L21